jgi:tRNA(fMet)-specific endonuclease VapC
MYVVDTNTLIYFFKGLGNVASNLLKTSPKNVGIPAVVLHELHLGIIKSHSPKKRTSQLNDLVSIVNVLPFGELEAVLSAQIRYQLEKKGNPIGPYDTLIAGTALAHKAALITHNIKEFNRIKGLKVVDWY